MPLTNAQVSKASSTGKAYKLWDGGGLFLQITAAGTKSWRMKYMDGGKYRLVTLGKYPQVSLSQARNMRNSIHMARRRGETPVKPKIVNEKVQELTEDSFEVVAKRWFEARKVGWVSSYSSRILSRLEADIFPHLGAKPIGSIEPPELLEVIRRIEARGARVLAGRINATCGQIFRFAIAEGRATRDPSADLRGALSSPTPPKHRAALREKDIPKFLCDLADYDGDVQTKQALRLTLLTFVRTNEVRFARWSEFEGLDGKEPLWRIPAERMKMSREHLVPLSRQVVELLGSIPRRATEDLLFRGKGKKGVMSENTMIYALYRMGYRSRLTVHGFRRMASTILNERGFNRDWIERQLAHEEANEVRRAYNAAEYLPDRRKMMQWWADYLDQQEEIGSLVG